MGDPRRVGAQFSREGSDRGKWVLRPGFEMPPDLADRNNDTPEARTQTRARARAHAQARTHTH